MGERSSSSVIRGHADEVDEAGRLPRPRQQRMGGAAQHERRHHRRPARARQQNLERRASASKVNALVWQRRVAACGRGRQQAEKAPHAPPPRAAPKRCARTLQEDLVIRVLHILHDDRRPKRIDDVRVIRMEDEGMLDRACARREQTCRPCEPCVRRPCMESGGAEHQHHDSGGTTHGRRSSSSTPEKPITPSSSSESNALMIAQPAERGEVAVSCGATAAMQRAERMLVPESITRTRVERATGSPRVVGGAPAPLAPGGAGSVARLEAPSPPSLARAPHTYDSNNYGVRPQRDGRRASPVRPDGRLYAAAAAHSVARKHARLPHLDLLLRSEGRHGPAARPLCPERLQYVRQWAEGLLARSGRRGTALHG